MTHEVPVDGYRHAAQLVNCSSYFTLLVREDRALTFLRELDAVHTRLLEIQD